MPVHAQRSARRDLWPAQPWPLQGELRWTQGPCHSRAPRHCALAHPPSTAFGLQGTQLATPWRRRGLPRQQSCKRAWPLHCPSPPGALPSLAGCRTGPRARAWRWQGRLQQRDQALPAPRPGRGPTRQAPPRPLRRRLPALAPQRRTAAAPERRPRHFARLMSLLQARSAVFAVLSIGPQLPRPSRLLRTPTLDLLQPAA
mmetsp:Transcript_108119/g.316110  ORF Transcript_108119/g.316110 Transcript_108119/m.316110 type:complete len:200 (-) Transcript_108119:229-828(-)